MDKKEKQQLSEADICDLVITPAIKTAGWDPMQQMRREIMNAPTAVEHYRAKMAADIDRLMQT